MRDVNWAAGSWRNTAVMGLVIALLATLAPAQPVHAQPANGPVQRLSGDTRFATAAAISQATFAPSTTSHVIVATGEQFADAITAAPVARALRAPVLLVGRDHLPAAVAAEIERLAPERITLLGGEGAVSNAVEEQLKALATVRRIGGRDRFATAATLANYVFDEEVETVFVANGGNYPDALSAAPVAAAQGAPVLLVGRDEVPDVTARALIRLAPSRIVVVGSTGVVSSAVERRLGEFAQEVTRAGGASRFDTAVEMSSANFSPGVDAVYVATGGNFADALSAAPAAAVDGAPILLVTDSGVPSAVAEELVRLRPDRIVLLGGPRAVSAAVEDRLRQAVQLLPPFVTGVDAGPGELTIRWQSSLSPGVTGYSVQSSEAPDGPFTQIARVDPDESEFTLDGLQVGDSRHLRVLATAGGRTSTPSPTVMGLVGSDVAATAAEGTTTVPGADVLDARPVGETSLAVTLSTNRYAPLLGEHLVVQPSAAAPNGFIGRVTRATRAADGTVEVTLAPAALDEAFSEVALDIDVPVELDAVSTGTRSMFHQDAQGRVGFSADAFDCTDGTGNRIPRNEAFETLAGAFPLSAKVENLRATHHFDGGSWLTGRGPSIALGVHGETVYSVAIRAKADATCELSATFQRDHDFRKPIGTVGGVPIALVLAPHFSLNLSAAGQVQVEQRHYWGYAFDKYDGQEFRWTPSGSQSPLTFDGTAGIEVEAYLAGDLSVMFGGGRGSANAQAGLYAQFGPFLKAATTTQAADCVIVTGGFKAAFGIRLELWVARWDHQLADATWDRELGRFCGVPDNNPAEDARGSIARLSDGRSWFIDEDSVRHWIPNGGTYLCLTEWKGVHVRRDLSEDQILALPSGPDQRCTVDEARDQVIRRGDGTTWYVDNTSTRHWIPNGGTYLCLTEWKNKQVMNVTDGQADALPEGDHQTCTVTEARDRIIREDDGTAWYVDVSSNRHWIPNGGTYNCLVYLRGKSVMAVTQGQVDALPQGGNQVCLALLVGPDQTAFYVDETGERHWVPDGGTFQCLENRGVPVYRYDNWDTINQFDEHRDSWASC